MPAKNFICPDGGKVSIEKCFKKKGCRLKNRCATLPFLRLVGFDREFNGVTPSAAGNGPRQIWLKAIHDYDIDPDLRVWAAFGTGTHNKLSLHKYIHNVLSEEKLSDEAAKGISDTLEQDEWKEGWYILSDYKTWGSYKVAKATGRVQKEIPILGDDGKQLVFKSGKRKGQKKTKKIWEINLSKIDLKGEEYQLNRYRIFFERNNFPVSLMRIQAIPRDGATYIAESRGINRNIYIIPIKRLPDNKVLAFYQKLQAEVQRAFVHGHTRLCSSWESWEYRRCTEKYCEVIGPCKALSKKYKEKWQPKAPKEQK